MPRWRRIVAKAAIGAGAALLLYAALGFLAAPPLVKTFLIRKLERGFHRPASIRSVRVNPFTWVIQIRGLSVQDRESAGPLLSVEEIRADVEARSLYWKAPILRKLEVAGPRARIVRLAPAKLNISDLLKEMTSKKSRKAKGGFAMSDVLVREGRIDLEDRTGGPSHALTDLALSLPFVSTLPLNVRPHLVPECSANLDGKPIHVRGSVRALPDGEEASVRVALEGFDLVPLFELLSVDSTARLVSGRLDGRGLLTFRRPRKGAATVGYRGTAGLRDFRLVDLQGRPVMDLPRLELDVALAEFLPPAYRLNRLTLEDPALHLRKGQPLLVFLDTPGEKPPTGHEVRPKAGGPQEGPAKPPVPFYCGAFEVKGGSFDYSDPSRKEAPTLALHGVNVSVRGLGTGASDRATVEVETATGLGETLRHSGTLTLAPLAAAGRVRLSGLHLPALAALLGLRGPLKVEKGTADLSSDYAFSRSPDGSRLALSKLSADLRALQLKEEEGGEVVLDLPSATLSGAGVDFAARDFSAASLETRGLRVRATRAPDGRTNLAALVRLVARETADPGDGESESGTEAAAPAPGSRKPAWRFSLKSFKAEDAGFRWEDLSGGHTLLLEGEPLDLTAQDLSNAPGSRARVSVRIDQGDQGSLAAEGSLAFKPLSVEGQVHVRGIRLEDLASAYRDFVHYDVQGGSLDLAMGVAFRKDAQESRLAFTGIEASVTSARLKSRDSGEVFLDVPALRLSGAEVDVTAKRFSARELALRQARVTVRRDPGGQVNLPKLLPRAAAVASEFSTTSRSAPWAVALSALKLEDCSAAFEDRGASAPVSIQLSDLDLTAGNLSEDLKTPAQVSFTMTWNRTGALSGRGTVSLRPLTAALAVDLRNLDVAPLSPYRPDWLAASLAGGAATAQGDLSFRQEADGRFTALFSGDASLDGLSALDPSGQMEVLEWESLSLKGLRAQSRPGHLEVREAGLLEPSYRLQVSPDGRWSFGSLLKAPKPSEGKTKKVTSVGLPPPPFPIRVGLATIRHGTVTVTDRSQSPPFNGRLTELECRIAGFSSEPGSRSQVEIKGVLGGSAPLRIAGSLDPIAPDLFADLSGSLAGFDAARLSPYAGRYLGYTVQKGRLSMDASYRLEGGKLSGDNHVHLDRFAWGEKTESPQATERSVLMATKLLMDRKGSIDFHVPVTGTLAGPQFHLKSAIGQAFKGFFTKVAAAPFAFFAASLGKAPEELSYAEFDRGTADATPGGSEKIAALARALADRPALSIEITGRASDDDGEGLKRALLRERALLEKQGAQKAAGASTVPLSRMALDPGEYASLLERLYRKSFPASSGSQPSPPDMEKALLGTVRITDDDLRELAQDRAGAARDLLAQGGADPKQIFLVAPKLADRSRKEDAPASRVDFALK